MDSQDPAPSPVSPADLVPTPAQLLGLIQACGKCSLAGPRSLASPGCLFAQMRLWAPTRVDLINLLNCNSLWLMEAGSWPEHALSSAAAGCREPKGGGLAGASPPSSLGPSVLGSAMPRVTIPAKLRMAYGTQGRAQPRKKPCHRWISQKFLEQSAGRGCAPSLLGQTVMGA